ncbi:Glycosyl transferase family 2 [Sulfitobacter noctilucicola]|uniref:Glycosyl transferase family 2 n=1 Tax=Sulfitobacter noctilucicola TaxID=1342301 RepID=A0A7W6M9I1_9RHOB|nr:glycosyltransferase family 2 protein [Sulfitobacter noctilucicola]KIN63740.1 Glycosyl transferase family 2 [Sulfitobacter noctilucicola]MBB4174751.1 hypothetical protein [Sulfitobacter noctilucicola]
MRPPTGGPGFDAIKPRIFQIGFNKCGTRSFYDFFEKNGIKSVHYKRGDLAHGISSNIAEGKPPLEGWDKWTAYTDMQWVKKTGVIEACGFYKEFAAYYPRSYFILNTRSKDRWIKSRLNHGTGQNYGNRYRLGLGLSTMDETVAAWSAMWDLHHENVQRFFAETGQNFLVYNIEEDVPESLERFLAPDFETDASLFGHEGQTNSEPKTVKASQPVAEKASNPYISNVSAVKGASKPAAPKPAVEANPLDEKLGKKFQPHNNLVAFDEAATMEPFDAVPIKNAEEGWTGNLIVSIVKNEGPFLLEWIAYHRAIGFNHFLIFSHACSDGTDKMLAHLDKQGIVTHVPLGNLEDTTPQAAALEDVMKHPKVFAADWIVHIDVDEFVNIRTDDGTFASLIGSLPSNVTNIAMTWRIFGSGGKEQFEDQLTLAQFDRCAPSYLPKPHTAWGFKTATSNGGAYQSLTAHRPGSIAKGFEKEVTWVNGSGKDITDARAKSGWRSDVKTVGYDLVQLNRYPLRTLDNFLLKREEAAEGGKPELESWIALDWNGCQDMTIQRNLPRMQAALDQLKDDDLLQELHESAVDWHKERIAVIKKDTAIKAFVQEALGTDLDDVSRVIHILENDRKGD